MYSNGAYDSFCTFTIHILKQATIQKTTMKIFVENRFLIPPVSIVCSQDLTSQATSINIIRETHRFLVTGVHLLFRCGRELYSPGEKKVSQPFH